MDNLNRKNNEERDSYSSYESFLKNNQEIYISGKKTENGSKKHPANKHLLKRLLRIIILVILSSIIIWGAYFILKIGFTGRKISIENGNSSIVTSVGSFISSVIPSDRNTLNGENDGRINILLLGTAGKGKPGQNLTDTIMIMSLDTKNKKVALLSLPRDFYANISGTNYSTKLNSIYQYGINNQEGVEPLKKTVEEITGIPIHYFIVLDFEGFKKIINDIGGINVSVERDIYDPRYPGPNYSYETFEIKKGIYLMNGDTALKYVRERHDDPEGDFGRAKRQQQIMQTVKNKVFSLKTLLNPLALNNLLTDLGDNVKTDIQLNEITGFLDISKKYDTQNITNAVVDAWKKDSILKVSHVFSGGVQAFVLVPKVGNYSEIQDLAQNIFDLDVLRRRTAEIEKENASITVINQSQYQNLDSKVKDILENKLGTGSVVIARAAGPKNSETSFVYDNTNGQKIFTLDEIIKKLGVKLGDNNNDIIKEPKSDLVLVLGNDLKNIGSFEEDNVDDFKNAPDSQNYFELIKK
jgi:LCP family protein required for cell wall assembly